MAKPRREFQRQAHTLARPSHPKWVDVIGFFVQAGNLYLENTNLALRGRRSPIGLP